MIISQFPPYKIYEFDIIDSTNLYAKQIEPLAAGENIVIYSHNQTAGRGRGAKEWVSEEGNLFFSIIISAQNLTNPALVSYMAALSVCRAIEKHNLKPQIKWPNDIFLEDKKICGILPQKYNKNIIIGIGVNLSSAPEYLENGRKAGFLESYNNKISKEDLLKNILKNFDEILQNYKKSGFNNIKSEILLRLYKLNEIIELNYIGKKIVGNIKDISDEGDLIISTENGMEQYKTGEIFDLEPA